MGRVSLDGQSPERGFLRFPQQEDTRASSARGRRRTRRDSANAAEARDGGRLMMIPVARDPAGADGRSHRRPDAATKRHVGTDGDRWRHERRVVTPPVGSDRRDQEGSRGGVQSHDWISGRGFPPVPVTGGVIET